MRAARCFPRAPAATHLDQCCGPGYRWGNPQWYSRASPRMQHSEEQQTVHWWLARCLGREDVTLEKWARKGGGHGSRVWECAAGLGGEPLLAMVKVYDEGCAEYFGLPPQEAARKHSLALTELPSHGIAVPRLLGSGALFEKARPGSRRRGSRRGASQPRRGSRRHARWPVSTASTLMRSAMNWPHWSSARRRTGGGSSTV